jgi:hypothetical protein
MAMRREDKFGYGFTLVGLFMSYLLDKIFGPTVGLIVAIAGCVIGIVLIASGHLGKEKKNYASLGIAGKAVVIAVALVAIGTISFLGWRVYERPAEQHTSQPQQQLGQGGTTTSQAKKDATGLAQTSSTKYNMDNVTEAIWFGFHGNSRGLAEQFREVDQNSLGFPSGANSINTVDNFSPETYDKAWASTFGKVLLCDPANGVIGSAFTVTVSRHPSIAVQILNASFNGSPCRVVAHISASAVTNAIPGYVLTGNAGQHLGYILDLPVKRDTFGLRYYMTGEAVKEIAHGYLPRWKSFAIDDPNESIQLELTSVVRHK